MGRIFYLMGKSSSGKDSFYKQLTKDQSLHLKKIVTYTTRPIREGETDGKEYFFVDEEKMYDLEKQGKIIEKRAYQTIHGIWYYFTVFDEQIHLEKENYLVIGTLESYLALKKYFGPEFLVPIYIEVDDGARIQRALDRERSQKQPKYLEMCRRFLADSEDFSDEKIQSADIRKRFENKNFSTCLEQIREYICSYEEK